MSCPSGAVVRPKQRLIEPEVLLTFLRLPIVCELLDLHATASIVSSYIDEALAGSPNRDSDAISARPNRVESSPGFERESGSVAVARQSDGRRGAAHWRPSDNEVSIMPAPRQIIDSLESVASIYFSDVRHKHRAAFVLTDELVEVTCKARAQAANAQLNRPHFPQLISHPSVGLNPANSQLGQSLTASHQTRNQLQHANAALAVDDQHCADAILDAVETDHCFPNSSAAFPDHLKIALRVVRLHSSQGNPGLRGRFEDAMRSHRWNGAQRYANATEPPVAVGIRRYWGLIILPEYTQVETILNRVGVP